jgi:hypothetical protein
MKTELSNLLEEAEMINLKETVSKKKTMSDRSSRERV